MDQADAARTAADGSISVPMVIDLGKKSKKSLRRLKDGTGPLPGEVWQAIEQVRARLPEADKRKQIIPVVIVYRRKAKRSTTLPLPFSPLSLFR